MAGPVISGIDPTEVTVKQNIRITGVNLASVTDVNFVLGSDTTKSPKIHIHNSKELDALVPDVTKIPDTYNVKVITKAGQESNYVSVYIYEETM